jgi:hypothetical protein
VLLARSGPRLGPASRPARRASAAEAWFEGQGDWPEAFPELASAPVGDPGFLAARLWQLQARAELRAEELSAPYPQGFEQAAAPLLESWREAARLACQAEERADVLEQRFVAGLRSALARAPALSDEAVAAQLETWAQLRELPEQPSAAQLAVSAAAGQAARDLERVRLLAWRAATIPGDPVLSQAVEQQLSLLPESLPDDPALVLALEARVDRLERVAPLLGSSQSQAVSELALGLERLVLQAEKAELELALAADPAPAPAGPEPDLAQLEAQVQQLHLRLEEARADLGSELHAAGSDGLHQEVAQLRVWLGEKRLAARQAALERARRIAVTGLEHEQSEARLAQARREAELARQRADEEGTQAQAALRQQVADLRLEITELVEEENARREASVDAIEAQSVGLEEHQDALLTALSLPPLDPQRQDRLDDAYLGLRSSVEELRAALRVRVAQVASLEADGAARRSELQQLATQESRSSSVGALIADARTAQADLERVLDEREQAAADELDAVLRLLSDAKRYRRRARDEASVKVRSELSRTFLPELVAELAELPVRLGGHARHAGPWLRSLPERLLDLSAISVFIAGSAELLLLGLLWVWMRRALPGWLDRSLREAQLAAADRDARGLPRWLADQALRWLEPGDLGRQAPAAAAATRVLVDLLASWQLARMLSDGLVVVAVLAWIFAAVVLWRALPALVEATLAVPAEQRAAPRVVSPAGRERALWTARLVLGWWLALVLGRLVSLRLLDADHLYELVGMLGSLAFWVVLTIIVHRWSPQLVAALGEKPDSRLVRWAGRSSSSWLLRSLQGATALGLLLVHLLGRYAARLAGTGPNMSRIAALVARRQLKDASERRGDPLASPLVQRLEAMRPPVPGYEALQVEIEQTLGAWCEQRRRGLYVVTADRGQGKTTLLTRLGRSLASEHQVSELHFEHPVDGPDGARAWLAARVLERSDSTALSREELIDEISLLSGPRVFLVDDMERLFLREVGGFATLRAVLQVMHATSDEHFWICSFHGPTWSYLRGVPGVFDPAFFEGVYQLPLVGPDQLARWLATVVQQAELELGFDDLAGIGPNTLEADRLRKRAELAYWRLLADASAGNPQVARTLFLSGLSRHQDHLRVGLFDAPTPAQLHDLSDNELFVLTAVAVHDRLDVDQLARVSNLPRSGVRTACQRLVARGVLAAEGFEISSRYELQVRWLPAVERHLRNKNFLAAK